MVVTFASGILYDYDSDAIRPSAAVNLQALATSLKKHGDTELLIVGHTDAMGSSAYNQDLSTRRADSAFRYLGVEGISLGRMSTAGRGELEAVASNEQRSPAQPAHRSSDIRQQAARTAATQQEIRLPHCSRCLRRRGGAFVLRVRRG
jgi:outer membrane protein OmpA-like peptidoglycan-associated protein